MEHLIQFLNWNYTMIANLMHLYNVLRVATGSSHNENERVMEEQQTATNEDDFARLATEKLFHSKKVKHPGLASHRQYYEAKRSWNKFIGEDFASRRPAGMTGGQTPPAEYLPKSHTRPGRTQTSAVARLYELKMQRVSMQRNLGSQEEEQNDVGSVSNMSTGTFSRPPSILSDASTKILEGPIAKSAWKPLRSSKGVVGRKAKGVGLLHVDGAASDFVPLRDTYGEQKQEPMNDRSNETTAFRCADAGELRSRMKSEMHLFPGLEMFQDAQSVVFHFSKRLSSLERTDAFSRLHMLQKEANSRIADEMVDVDEGDMNRTISYPLSSAPCRLRPEVIERLERIRKLSEHAEKLYMVGNCT